ncbi:MAG: DUF1553 domain-containing protein [Pirellulales bacterium]
MSNLSPLGRRQRFALFAITASALLPWSATFSQNAKIDFAHEIVPVLKKHCAECHTGSRKEGSLSINTRADLLAGGENGKAIEPGKPDAGRLLALVRSADKDERMPPEGDRLSNTEIKLLERWIAEGAPWEDGFSFQPPTYEPPLLPRNPTLPAAHQGRTNPIDRIIDNYLIEHGKPIPESVNDAQFARRAALDLVGLLPEATSVHKLQSDSSPLKRSRFTAELLADDTAYAEHWLTFWNDLLRNDYDGTGFITGGRRQISGWLYDSLIHNKPYDKMVRELIAPPTDDSRGFIDGIKWRGEVSAGQTVEIQFAQSVGQSLLGINLKCASCHDSFTDRWKLDDSYGLAAIYSSRPLEIHRCDKPVGRRATAAWLFPEIGQVDPQAAPADRLKQLAELMVHPQNGRFTRTIVNRLWHRMMGRGIVHPTDAMQTEPWNADLLDFLASDFAEHGYDLKRTLRLIADSAAYQSRCEKLLAEAETGSYVYAGPRARRMTAEQFIDTVRQITGTSPGKMDASFMRGKIDPSVAKTLKPSANWIWSPLKNDQAPGAGEKRTFRKEFDLAKQPARAEVVVTCDNKFTLFVNGKKAASGDNWNAPVTVSILNHLKVGNNRIDIGAVNEGASPNPAGLFVEGRIRFAESSGADPDLITIQSDTSWNVSESFPGTDGKFKKEPADWKPAEPVAAQETWKAVDGDLQNALARTVMPDLGMVRASLLKSDPLMRSLGRPNRDQIVTVRPNELSTLEAIDLANGSILSKMISAGAENLLKREWKNSDALTESLVETALSRKPTADELSTAREMLGPQPTQRGLEDLLWVVIMLPEFQIVR